MESEKHQDIDPSEPQGRDHFYDKVIFIPSNIPTHKPVEPGVSPFQRMEMLGLAISHHPEFIVDTCEIDRGGVSYSVDTVKYLKKKYAIIGKPGFLIGDDLIDGFISWKNAERLSTEVHLIVVHRRSLKRMSFEYPHSYMDNPVFPISSTDIRQRISANGGIRFLLPEAVWQFIRENKLYGVIRPDGNPAG